MGERCGLLSLKGLVQRESCMREEGPDVIVQGRKWGLLHAGGAEGMSCCCFLGHLEVGQRLGQKERPIGLLVRGT